MTTSYLRMLAAALKAGDLGMAKQFIDEAPGYLREVLPAIFELDVRNTYREALSQDRIDVILGLGNSLNWNIGDPYDVILRTETVASLREATQNRDADALAKIVFPLLERALEEDSNNPVSLEDGVTKIFICGNKYTLGNIIVSSPDSTINISEVLDELGRLAILETAHLAALSQKGFPTLESWQAYLRTQFNYDVTFRTCSMQHDNVIYTIYEIPEGFHSLLAAKNSLSTSPENAIFQLIQNIGDSVQLTRWDDGKFQSVGPSTVFADILHSVRIVGLALATATPIYGSRLTVDIVEDSQVAYQRFMAILASELLFDEVPEPTSNAYEFLIGQHREISRPFRHVLSRLLDRKPDWRYTEWQLALVDIGQALKILNVGQFDSDEAKELYDFAAYLDFRMSITRRNPRNNPAFSREFTYRVVDRIFRDVQAEGSAPRLEILTNPFRSIKRVTICSREAQRSLLFVSRMLITLADGYRKILQEDQYLKTVIVKSIVPDILLSVFWLEAETLVKSIASTKAASNPDELGDLLEFLRTELLNLPLEEFSEIQILPRGVLGATAIGLSDVISSEDLRYLVDTLQRLLNNPDYDASKSNLRSTTQLVFAVLVLEGQVEFISKDSPTKTVGLSSANQSEIFEWTQAVRSLTDTLTINVGNGLNDDRILMAGEELSRLFSIADRIRPFDRKNGTVLRYNFIQREGKVRYRKGLRFLEPFFGNYAIGTAAWEHYTTLMMPCTVDVRRDPVEKTHKTTKISIGPKGLVESRFSNWKSKLRRVFSRTQSGRGDNLTAILFWAMSAFFLVALILGSMWGWWISASGAFFSCSSASGDGLNTGY